MTLSMIHIPVNNKIAKAKIFCINSLFVNFVLVCFENINETTNNIFDAKFHRLVSVYIYNGVTISLKKYTMEKKSIMLRSSAHA